MTQTPSLFAARGRLPALPLTVGQAVRRHAVHRPQAIALLDGATRRSFADLDRRADQVAHALVSVGVAPGAHVAYLGKNSIALVEVAVGVQRAGAVFVPLNWRLAPPELTFMLDDCAAAVLVVDAEYRMQVEALASSLQHTRAFVVVDVDAGAPSVAISPARSPEGDETVMTGAWPGYERWLADAPQGELPNQAEPDDVAFLVYTSGTTGRPKGVMLSHRNVRTPVGLEVPEAEWPAWNRWSPCDVSLVTSPLFHVGGLGWLLRGLFPGSMQVLLREFSVSGVLDAVERHRTTRVALVPSAMRMVLDDPRAGHVDFGCVDIIYYGSSPIPLDLLREGMRVFQCRFAQSYGLTECASSAVCLAPEDHTLADVPRMRSAGRALPGVEVAIHGAQGQLLAPGAIGEIVLRSAATMRGYLNRPEDTAQAFAPGGWLRSGDAGRMDADGYVYVQDRIKEMIITGGENVYPAEVENALYGHPAIGDVAVIGVPSQRWGQEVKAVVELRPGQQVTADELIAFARRRIGGYKCPKSVDFVDALPRNTAGKVVKGELRQRYC